MFDTLKFKLTGSRFTGRVPLPWSQTLKSLPGSAGLGVYGNAARRCLVDPVTGTRVRGDAEMVHVVEASLPRVEFEHNGRLLTTQSAVEAAEKKLWGKVAEVASAPTAWQLSAIDLVLHVPGETELFVQSHRSSRYPGIRSAPLIWEGSQIVWGSGKAQMRIKFYDKMRQMHRKGGSFTRVEISLRGEPLRREFGGEVTALDFSHAYQIFRRLMLRFRPAGAAPKLRGVASILALAARTDWKPYGIPLFDTWKRSVSAGTVRRMRQTLARTRLESFPSMDWSKLLPVAGPPAPIEVLP